MEKTRRREGAKARRRKRGEKNYQNSPRLRGEKMLEDGGDFASGSSLLLFQRIPPRFLLGLVRVVRLPFLA
jgi:hypothetical protein